MFRTFAQSLVATLFFSSAWGAVNGPQVNIQSGAIEGRLGKYKTEAFFGIPYAAPPVGNLRWKAPRPPTSWQGVYSAKKLPPACPQMGNFFAHVPSSQFEKPVGNEDCLYLNIWKPTQIQNAGKLPVVFWIHGGSNFKGTSSDPMYDGAYLAAHSNVVFVSLNYRLGMLGAMASDIVNQGSELDKSGNYVTLDLIQGLKWVRDNVESFGGDPDNITIMGQSAGCMNVWGLLQSPLSENLFHKAVCSSGLPNSYPKAIAEKRADCFIENLIVNAGLVKDKDAATEYIKSKSKSWLRKFLVSRSSDEIVAAQDYIVPVQHIQDGVVFPHGLEGAALGKFHRVPIIMGSTLDEGTYMVGGRFLKPSPEQLWDWIQDPPTHLKVDDLIDTNYLAFEAVTKSSSMALQNTLYRLYLSAWVYTDAYLYSFEWKETPSPWREVFGAVHGLDSVFYLGNFDQKNENFARFALSDQNKASREALRAEMNKHFTRFFWEGNPHWGRTTVFK